MMQRLATRMGCTEGQAYTAVLGLVLAVALVTLGLPPTLRSQPLAQTVPQDDPFAGTSAAPATPSSDALPDDPSLEAHQGGLDVPDAVAVAPPGSGGTPPAGDAPRGGRDTAPQPTPPGATPRPVPADPRGAGPSRDGRAFGDAEVFAPVGDPGAPRAVTVGTRGQVYVATDNAAGRGVPGPSVVMRYAPDGTLERSYALAGQAEGRRYGLVDLVVDARDRVFALDAAAGEVLQVDLDRGRQRTVVTLPSLPPCTGPLDRGACRPGLGDGVPLPRAAVFDDRGALYVSDAGQATIWRVAPGSGPEVWHQASDYALRTPPDGGLAGLAFDREGDLLLLVQSSLADGSVSHGVVHRLAVTSSGDAGSRIEVARTAPGSAPFGIAAGDSGRSYLTLSGADELLVLEEDGSEAHVIGADDVAQQAGIPLDGPSGLAFRGGSLLVANTSALRNEPDHWAVLEIVVRDPVAVPRRVR